MKNLALNKYNIIIGLLSLYIILIGVLIISSLSSPTSSTVTTDNFTITTDANLTNGILAPEYTCDGAENSPSLSWKNAPTGTKDFVILMSTIPVDEPLKYSWVIYNISATADSIPKNNVTIGTYGMGDHKATLSYQAPCSQGPGEKIYTITVYALSDTPILPEDPNLVTGSVVKNAISGITLSSASIDLHYSRSN